MAHPDEEHLALHGLLSPVPCSMLSCCHLSPCVLEVVVGSGMPAAAVEVARSLGSGSTTTATAGMLASLPGACSLFMQVVQHALYKRRAACAVQAT